MSVKVENLEHNTAKLTIEVAADEFDKAMNNAYMKQKKDIQVPGFRKGKVPRQLIEKMYGPSVFYEDAANETIQNEYPKAAEECGLTIISRPEINVEQIEKGKEFIFTAVVAVTPEVTLGEYKGLEVPVQDREVKDEDVDAEIKKEQERNSRMVSVEDRAAELGDTVTLDYTGTIDGVEFAGGSAKAHALELGSGSFIPGFEDQLVGVKAGESKDVEVTFPEEYHAEDLKGKAAVFACDIIKVEKKELPELDDDFAQDVSEFDTFEEYKESVKKSLAEKKEEQAKNNVRGEAIDKAAQNAQIDLPEILIADRAERLTENMAQEMQSQGLGFEQFLQITNQTYDQVIASARPRAEKMLRQQFTLEKIAEIEGLEVTDEKLEEEMKKEADRYGLEIEKFKEYMPEDYTEELKANLLIEMAAEIVGDAAVETEAAAETAEEAKEEKTEE